MKLSDLSVRRPVFATVLSLLIVAFGLISYFRLPVRELPNIDVPIVSVETRYRGAAAAVVESRITQIIEDRLSGIEGLKAITSTNRDGRSSIDIEFQINRDIDDAANDVRDRVSGVISNLPPEADPPQISKVDADAQPIMFVGLFSDRMSRLELTEYAERFITDRLSAVNGVARVQVFGGARPSMRIWLDRNRLAAFGMTTSDVEAALRRQNIELPAGRVESTKMNLTVRVERYYQTPEQFAGLIVQRGANGYLVRLGDVARIELGPENPFARFRGDGKDAAGIGIVRQSNANTLEVAQGVRKVVEEIDKSLPNGLKLSINFDSSVFIAEAIRKVWTTIFEAALLVVAVIFIFLGSVRATLIPAVAVPVSLLGAFIFMSALGYSLNLLTLLALVLAIGLVVDDAIVVLENIHHRTEIGERPLLAAYKGASEVGFAVIASTIVVIAVFVPIVFLSGTVGKLFTELAAAMVGAVAVSLLVSLTLTPALCAGFLKTNQQPGKFNIWIDGKFQALSDTYARLLARFSASSIPSVITILAVAGLIFVGGKSLKSELAPEEDSGIFWINGQLSEGAGFDYALTVANKMEAKLLSFRKENPAIFRIIVRAPGGGGPNTDEFNSVAATVILKDWSERSVATKDVVQDVQKMLGKIPEMRASANQRGSLSGSRGGNSVQFVIAGSSYSELARARDKIFDAAKDNPGFQNLEADYKETKPQLILSIDRNRAADLGISVENIGNTLETMMGSKRVTTFLRAGEEYDVILQADRMDRMETSDLANTYVRSSTTGQLVPLSNVLTMREKADAGTLGRYNKLRAITLQGKLAPGYTLGEALTFLENTARPMPEIAAIGYKGESRDLKETGKSIYFVLLLTIVVIYLVLAAQFESFIHPFTIILTVPLAVGGAVLGLWLLSGTLNIYSQVGVIMLVGLATKNGILIVEFANQLRDRGLTISQAIFEASTRRLRPVIMTSIATVAGALPLMLATGAGAASRTAIGIVIVFGVTIATLLTLFIIPSVYLRLARFTRSPDALSRDLDSQLAQGQTQPAE
jgi:multidrug efflux pump